MPERKSVVLVTGISGNLGLRLAPQLQHHDIVAVDLRPLTISPSMRLAQVDLGRESSCRALVELMRANRVTAVVHLAFDSSSPRNDSDARRMWQINVAGTARIMEAITEVNRNGGSVSRFLFTSGAFAYGAHLDSPAQEDSPLCAERLTYACHQREADEVVQYRASSLGSCHTTILRPALFAGASTDNYLIGALRGTPTQSFTNGKRLTLPLPLGQRYRQNSLEFVHIDDVARLIAHFLDSSAPAAKLSIFNVAGRDGAIPLEACEQIVAAQIRRLPGLPVCEALLRSRHRRGLAEMPPEALPYLIGSRPLDTSRLRRYLGSSYSKFIRHTTREALADSFAAVKHSLPTIANPHALKLPSMETEG